MLASWVQDGAPMQVPLISAASSAVSKYLSRLLRLRVGRQELKTVGHAGHAARQPSPGSEHLSSSEVEGPEAGTLHSGQAAQPGAGPPCKVLLSGVVCWGAADVELSRVLVHPDVVHLQDKYAKSI